MTLYYVNNEVGNDANAGTSEGAGNAWASITYAATVYAAGDIIYVQKTSTPYSEAKISLTTYGTSADRVLFVGYGTTINDGVKFEIDGLTTIDTVFNHYNSYVDIYNFDLTGKAGSTSNNGVSVGSPANHVLSNFIIRNCGGDAVSSSASSMYIFYGEMYGCGQYGAVLTATSSIFVSYINSHDNGLDGIYVGGGAYITYCLLVNNSRHNFQSSRANCPLFANNTLYGSGQHAIKFGTSYTGSIRLENNIIAGVPAGYYGIYASSAIISYIQRNNVFYVPDADGTVLNVNNKLGDAVEIILTGDPFTDSAGGDFTLNSVAGAGAACNVISFPGDLDSGSGNEYVATGAIQTLPPVGSTPVFEGIMQLEPGGRGLLYPQWEPATGTATGYKIYIKNGSAPSATDFLQEVNPTAVNGIMSHPIVCYPDGTLFMETDEIYVMVRAVNVTAIASDTNTEELHLNPHGCGQSPIVARSRY